jgi:hypothetical protein
LPEISAHPLQPFTLPWGGAKPLCRGEVVTQTSLAAAIWITDQTCGWKLLRRDYFAQRSLQKPSIGWPVLPAAKIGPNSAASHLQAAPRHA